MKQWDRLYNKLLSESNLTIEEFFSSTNDMQQIDEKINCAIIFNSSESRSLVYQQIFKENSFQYSILIDFKVGNNTSTEKEHNYDSNLTALIKLTDNTPIKLTIDSIKNYKNNLEQIIQKIPENTFDLHSKIFIDISSVPLIYSVALIRFFKLSFPSPEILLFNVSGIYPKNENNKFDFSDGISESIYIPGYHGYGIDHSKPRLLIFLLGFEGEKSFKAYRENEPKYVEVIIPEPGYEDNYPNETIYNNRIFLEESGFIKTINEKEYIDNKEYIKIERQDKKTKEITVYYFQILKEIKRIDIGCPVRVFEAIHFLCENEEYKNINISLVTQGPKPHAIGAALAAIENPNLSIIYQVPKKYTWSTTPAGNKMWIYKIN